MTETARRTIHPASPPAVRRHDVRGDGLVGPHGADGPTPRGPNREERLVAASQRRAARRTHVLTGLLDSRPELRGAYAPADFVDEAVRWSI